MVDNSFYLPGSVDVNDKQKEQWYAKPHVLSLWSRRDWTTRHKVIAREQSHLSSQPEVIKMDIETLPTDHDRNGNNGDKLMLSHDLLESTDDKKDQASMDEGKKISSHHRNVDQQSKEEPKHTISKSGKTSRKRKHRTERNDGRGPGLVSPAKRQAVNEIMEGGPDHSYPNPNNGRSSVEGSQPPPVICSNVEAGDGKVGPSVVEGGGRGLVGAGGCCLAVVLCRRFCGAVRGGNEEGEVGRRGAVIALLCGGQGGEERGRDEDAGEEEDPPATKE
ncbi:hypothetical protein RIF29_09585 [Crotalaria pallida]|uniref:DM2 domain-containing protein n=1 Tax=Crotalaria pallida TaxID=3830 RepID=A0AAN9FS27_CROPI